jgi:hypothetical protein
MLESSRLSSLPQSISRSRRTAGVSGFFVTPYPSTQVKQAA